MGWSCWYRRIQKFKGLKIVIFSAFADFSYAKTALENRVLHYFLKPIDPDEFQNILSEIVETVTREQEDGRRLQRCWCGNGGCDWRFSA